ncbi:hypothetical protein STEG23_001100, partial [Scotinomys teguina]
MACWLGKELPLPRLLTVRMLFSLDEQYKGKVTTELCQDRREGKGTVPRAPGSDLSDVALNPEDLTPTWAERPVAFQGLLEPLDYTGDLLVLK